MIYDTLTLITAPAGSVIEDGRGVRHEIIERGAVRQYLSFQTGDITDSVTFPVEYIG